MYIKKFEIEKLHGEYDYSITFNKDITFLFGPNGCGKTTILSILSSVITSRYYKLTDYSFQKVILTYSNSPRSKDKTIEVAIKVDDKNTYMEIIMEKRLIRIDELSTLRERIIRNNDENSDASFEELYPEIAEIKTIFHYVYLPLNRLASTETLHSNIFYLRSRRHYLNNNYSYTYLNDSLLVIEKLIKDGCYKIYSNELQINNSFRKKVLSSATRVSRESPISKIVSEIDKIDISEVLKAKESYINTLKDLEIFDKELDEKIKQFFEEFKTEYEKHQQEKPKISINYAFLYNDYLRIKQVVEFAKANEKEKEKNRHNIDLFIEIINDFFKTSGTDKKIGITKEGEIIIKTHNSNIELKDLSSGEKQIIITFATYIFGIEDNMSGVYIVDEPEASLHLEWQSMFVESLLKTKKKIQLIFATHSPELIGKYKNRSELLEHK